MGRKEVKRRMRSMLCNILMNVVILNKYDSNNDEIKITS